MKNGKAKERRKQFYHKVKGTEKHDMGKIIMRKTRKCHCSNIRESGTHTIEEEKRRRIKKFIMKNENQKKVFVDRAEKFMHIIQEGFYQICDCSNRCLYK